MIIIKIQGGLGNQMFQYAAGRALSLRHKTDLVLDLSWYDDRKAAGDTSRPYELDIFKHAGRVATDTELSAVRLVETPRTWKRRVGRLLWPQLPRLRPLWESGHQFNPAFEQAPDNSLLSGWWQTEKYFASVADIIRQDLAFAQAPSKENAAALKEIAAVTAVSIHVRRGDYVTNPDAAKFHGLAGLDYYHAAIKRTAESVKQPVLFVFSDDTKWCRQNLKAKYPVHYIEHNTGKHNYEDLRLMMSCKYHIIANSSFSWWGAWLSHSPSKLVIAPNRWFVDPGQDSRDVVPTGWIKL